MVLTNLIDAATRIIKNIDDTHEGLSLFRVPQISEGIKTRCGLENSGKNVTFETIKEADFHTYRYLRSQN